jgi:hypothetical protein
LVPVHGCKLSLKNTQSRWNILPPERRC